MRSTDKLAREALRISGALDEAREQAAHVEDVRHAVEDLEAAIALGEAVDRKALTGLKRSLADAERAAVAIPGLERRLREACRQWAPAHAQEVHDEGRGRQARLEELDARIEELSAQYRAQVIPLDQERKRLAQTITAGGYHRNAAFGLAKAGDTDAILGMIRQTNGVMSDD